MQIAHFWHKLLNFGHKLFKPGCKVSTHGQPWLNLDATCFHLNRNCWSWASWARQSTWGRLIDISRHRHLSVPHRRCLATWCEIVKKYGFSPLLLTHREMGERLYARCRNRSQNLVSRAETAARPYFYEGCFDCHVPIKVSVKKWSILKSTRIKREELKS